MNKAIKYFIPIVAIAIYFIVDTLFISLSDWIKVILMNIINMVILFTYLYGSKRKFLYWISFINIFSLVLLSLFSILKFAMIFDNVLLLFLCIVQYTVILLFSYHKKDIVYSYFLGVICTSVIVFAGISLYDNIETIEYIYLAIVTLTYGVYIYSGIHVGYSSEK